ncbi:hypothetical protein K438DRAFT_1789687 [Mycena galopus ATCC 62051]|nr:hypothetical protein K438DRAFT_1789687 [Mycena galopus ATCC 62051]
MWDSVIPFESFGVQNFPGKPYFWRRTCFRLLFDTVSSRSYQAAMCTPKLWSTVVVDTSVWSRCAPSATTLFGLLESSLNRGRNHPLVLEVNVHQIYPNLQSVLELLCMRWQDVYFCLDHWSSTYLAAAKGNLGQLDTLCISARWKGMDIFRDASRLKNFEFHNEVDFTPDLL